MPESYDEVLYPGYAYRQTHPDRLAAMATLFGMTPAPVEGCRVLELGCGEGGNLIPMAFGLPRSQFLGIDSAQRPIQKGQAMVETLGIENITLRQLDLMDVSGELGQFDYIVAHGLYAWVRPVVQDKILAIAKSNLAPNGVAFVSYSAYPGGHLRTLVREMMLYHIRNLDDPEQQISQAQALLRLLAESQAESDAYGVFLKAELNRVLERRGEFLYHDDLAQVFAPAYFHQFIEHAARHGLQYLAEAHFSDMHAPAATPAVAQALDGLAGGIVEKEQYLDFLKCRKLRQTLLCHQEVSLDRALKPEHMTKFYVASPAVPVSAKPDVCSEAAEEFRGPQGSGMVTAHRIAKAAIFELSEIWPQALQFQELLERVRRRLGGAASQDALALGEILLRTSAAGLVELHVHAFCFAAEAGERPVSSPLARLQLQKGAMITTLRHTRIEVEGELERQLLLLLDGTRDRAALLSELSPFARPNASTPSREIPPEDLESALGKLARLALLVA
jgi:methyltransferase-like protein/SAM-dependent methyltransferase